MIQGSYTIQLSDLTVGYEQPGGKPLELLSGLNFSAAPGEMVALIGENGIGKSTLLRTIAGFHKYLSGRIDINGRELKNTSAKEIATIMSFVSTENIGVSNMTVFDLVAYGRFPYTNWIGRLTEKDRDSVNQAIANVGLNELKNRQINRISDGERQRAMIARAVAQDTPVIILDEPTAFLDVSNKYEIFHHLQVLARDRGKTVILSTHDLNIALREVDKLWIVTQKGYFQGAPEDAVLNGWPDRMFINRHIGFDPREGEYFFKKEFKARIRVEGEGLPLIWTLRALNRQGYQIVVEAEPDLHITVKNNLWELRMDERVRTFNSIYQLLSFLG